VTHATRTSWENNHFICAASLITKNTQFEIAGCALQQNNAKLFNFVQKHLKAPFNDIEKQILVRRGEKANLHDVVKPLKDSLPPDDNAVSKILEKLITDNNLELFKLLLDSHWKKIYNPEYVAHHLRCVAQTALNDDKPEFALLLLAKAYTNARDIIDDFLCHRSLSLSQRLKVVKFLYQHHLRAILDWIFGWIAFHLALVATFLALVALCYSDLTRSVRVLSGFVKSLHARIKSFILRLA